MLVEYTVGTDDGSTSSGVMQAESPESAESFFLSLGYVSVRCVKYVPESQRERETVLSLTPEELACLKDAVLVLSLEQAEYLSAGEEAIDASVLDGVRVQCKRLAALSEKLRRL